VDPEAGIGSPSRNLFCAPKRHRNTAGADERDGTTRRRVLRTGAAALAGGLAGCGGDGSGAGNPTSVETATGTLTATPTPPASVSGTYRSFQYDAANAGSADAEGPTGTVGRLWRHREAALGPAHAVGSPAVADGRAFVVTAWMVTALDADSGEKRWRYLTNASSGGDRKPPVVLDGVAYVASAGLHAVGGTGD
jgi:outer membrane protein assembly factor BamB